MRLPPFAVAVVLSFLLSVLGLSAEALLRVLVVDQDGKPLEKAEVSVGTFSDKKGKKAGPDHLKPVGLLFAGSSVVTIANPIDAVLEGLGVQIDGQ